MVNQCLRNQGSRSRWNWLKLVHIPTRLACCFCQAPRWICHIGECDLTLKWLLAFGGSHHIELAIFQSLVRSSLVAYDYSTPVGYHWWAIIVNGQSLVGYYHLWLLLVGYEYYNWAGYHWLAIIISWLWLLDASWLLSLVGYHYD